MLLNMATNPRLPFSFRGAVISFCIALYVDRYPQEPNCGAPSLPLQLWIWSEQELPATCHLGFGGGQELVNVPRAPGAPLPSLSPIPTISPVTIDSAVAFPGFNISPLSANSRSPDPLLNHPDHFKFYLLRILCNQCVALPGQSGQLVHSEGALNDLLGAGLRGHRTLLDLGFHSTYKKLVILAKLILEPLDGRADLEKPGKPFDPPRRRYLTVPGSSDVITAFKASAIELLKAVGSMCAHVRLSKLLVSLKEDAAAAKVKRASLLSLGDPLELGQSVTSIVASAMAQDHDHGDEASAQDVTWFERFLDLFPGGKDDTAKLSVAAMGGKDERFLDEVLLDAVMYDDDALVASALSLLRSNYRAKHALMRAVGEIEVMPDAATHVFGSVHALATELADLSFLVSSFETWGIFSSLTGPFGDSEFNRLMRSVHLLLLFLHGEADDGPDSFAHAELEAANAAAGGQVWAFDVATAWGAHAALPSPAAQATLRSVNLQATLTAAFDLDVELAWKGSVCTVKQKEESERRLTLAKRALLVLARAFVRGNAKNQALVFRDLDALVEIATPVYLKDESKVGLNEKAKFHVPAPRPATREPVLLVEELGQDLIMAVLAGNERLSGAAPPELVTLFASLCDHFRPCPSLSPCLELFFTLCVPNRAPIRRAQARVLDALVDAPRFKYLAGAAHGLFLPKGGRKVEDGARMVRLLSAVLAGGHGQAAQRLLAEKVTIDHCCHALTKLDNIALSEVGAGTPTNLSAQEVALGVLMSPLGRAMLALLLDLLSLQPVALAQLQSKALWEFLTQVAAPGFSALAGSESFASESLLDCAEAVVDLYDSVFSIIKRFGLTETVLGDRSKEQVRNSAVRQMEALLMRAREVPEALEAAFMAGCEESSSAEGLDLVAAAAVVERLERSKAAAIGTHAKHSQAISQDVLEHAFRAADGHGTGNGIISLYEFESFLFNVGLGGAPADGVPFSRRTVQNMKRFVGAVFSDSVVPQLLTRQDKYQAPGAAVAKAEVDVEDLDAKAAAVYINVSSFKRTLANNRLIQENLVRTSLGMVSAMERGVQRPEIVPPPEDLKSSAEAQQPARGSSLDRLAPGLSPGLAPGVATSPKGLLERAASVVRGRPSLSGSAGFEPVTWADLCARLVRFCRDNMFEKPKRDSEEPTTCEIILDAWMAHLVKARTLDSGDGPLRALGFEELGDRGLEAGYVAKQRALSELGVTKLLCELIVKVASPDGSGLPEAALGLLAELLNGENKGVARAALAYLTAKDTECVFLSHLALRLDRDSARLADCRARTTRAKASKSAKGAQAAGAQAAGAQAAGAATAAADQELVEACEAIALTARVMQLLCAGHNGAAQDWLREQPALGKNVNVFAKLLRLFEQFCASSAVVAAFGDLELATASQLLSALTDLMLGPCLENQVAFSSSADTVMALNFVLAADNKRDEALAAADPTHSTLLDQAALTLASTLEGRTDYIVHAYLDRFAEVDRLERLQDLYYFDLYALRDEAAAEGRPWTAGEATRAEALSEALSALLFVLKELSLPAAGGRCAVRALKRQDPELEFGYPRVDPTLFGRVEVWWDGAVQAGYFPIGPHCRFLTPETKAQFLETADLTTADRRMGHLLRATPGFMDEMDFIAERANSDKWYRFMFEWNNQLRPGLYVLSVLMVFLTLTLPHDLSQPYAAFENHRSGKRPLNGTNLLALALVLIGGFALTLGYLATLHHHAVYDVAMHASALDAKSAALRLSGAHAPGSASFVRLEPLFAVPLALVGCGAVTLTYRLNLSGSPTAAFDAIVWAGFGLVCAFSARAAIVAPWSAPTRALCIALDTVALSGRIRDSLLCACACFAGMIRVEFFSLVLLDVVQISATLGAVLRSVTRPAAALALVLYLFAVGCVIFASFGREFFGSMMQRTRHHRPDRCATHLDCFFSVFYSGLIKGDLSDAMRPAVPGFRFLPRLGFDSAFFIFASVILANVVTGIIVDAFGSTHEEKGARELILATSCFVCGFSAGEYEELGLKPGSRTFEEHCALDHDPWTYVAFVAHVRSKARSALNSLETHALHHLDAGHLYWLPTRTSVAVQDHRAEQAALAALDSGGKHGGGGGGGGGGGSGSESKPKSSWSGGGDGRVGIGAGEGAEAMDGLGRMGAQLVALQEGAAVAAAAAAASDLKMEQIVSILNEMRAPRAPEAAPAAKKKPARRVDSDKGP